jgi:hypothetical protein
MWPEIIAGVEAKERAATLAAKIAPSAHLRLAKQETRKRGEIAQIAM